MGTGNGGQQAHIAEHATGEGNRRCHKMSHALRPGRGSSTRRSSGVVRASSDADGKGRWQGSGHGEGSSRVGGSLQQLRMKPFLSTYQGAGRNSRRSGRCAGAARANGGVDARHNSALQADTLCNMRVNTTS
eukprot:1901772-Prymnesium_polylepis.1